MKESFSLSQIDMNLLVVFDILIQEQSLTRTAERLSLTTPAVSSAVKRLQQMLNDPIVIRKGRVMEPTSRALELHEQLTPGLDVIRESLRFFSGNDYPSQVVFGVPAFFDAIILPALFNSFPESERSQLVTRELKLFDHEFIENSLIYRKFDVVISPMKINHYNLVSESLGEDELMLVYRKGHSIFSRETVTEENITTVRHVAFEMKVGGVPVYDLMIQVKKQRDTIACFATSPLAACQVVANTDMVTIMPGVFTRQISKSLKDQDLLEWQPISFFRQKVGYYLTYHNRYSRHPGITRAREVLLGAMRK